MNGKHYSEGSLSSLIDTAHQYIDAASVRESIIAKCHQELGMIVAGAPVHQRANITLTDQEAAAMRKAVLRWRQGKKQARDKSG
jgi:hypothetical protein